MLKSLRTYPHGLLGWDSPPLETGLVVRAVSPRLGLQGEERVSQMGGWCWNTGITISYLGTAGQQQEGETTSHSIEISKQRQTTGHSDYQQMLVNHRFRASLKQHC